MAKITSTSEEKVYKISEWLGLNENPDGDTRLKLGEAAVMRNFKITRDGSLQKRPGLKGVERVHQRHFLYETGETMQLASNLMNVIDRIYVDPISGEITNGNAVWLRAEEFETNPDIHCNVLESPPGNYYRMSDVQMGGEYPVWNAKKLAVGVKTERNPGFVVQYYRWAGGNGTFAMTTSEPELEVYRDAIVNKNTGEVSLSETWMVSSDEDFSRYAENQNIHVMSDGSYYTVVDCAYNSSTKLYKWEMCEVFVSLEQKKLPVKDLWSGYVGGKYRLMGVVNGYLAEIHNGDEFVFRYIDYFGGSSNWETSLFGFADKLYICTSGPGFGVRYYYWDGTKEFVDPVEGYWPVVAVSISPESGTTPEGSLLERVNLMTDIRRVWLSPERDKGRVYVLPEDATRIQYVKSLVSGDVLSSSNYKIMNISWNGHIRVGLVFGDTDTAGAFLDDNYGINTIEVCYAAPYLGEYGLEALFSKGARISVEQYNGTSDSRLFLCSDNSNKVYYSGLDYNGQPRADYFPDMNVISVGESSDTVTGMIRHYSRLIVYKANSTYSIQYGTIGLADGTTTAAFYCTPINKRLGNDAFGQVRLVLNSPRTLHGRDLYEWRNNTSYSSNLSVDERQAKRISDRIHKTLASFDFSQCYCYDDNDNQEYYICYDKKALVHNYAVDAWYYYDNFDVTCMVNFGGELYAGDSQGRFNLISRENRTDNGEEITACWESGSEPFGRDFMRKYSAMMWIGIKPELRSQVDVTVRTDRSGNMAEKTVAASLATFEDADFRDWSFNTSRMPQMSRLKIKAKKFVYYKLIFEMSGENTTATIVSADVRVRFTGYAR